MITLKCPQCGEQVPFDESKQKSIECPRCGNILSMENGAPDVHNKFIKRKEELEQKLKEIEVGYEETNDAKDVHTIVESYTEYTALPDFNSVWNRFILNVVGLSASKKDKELQTYLKNHARAFDENLNAAGGNLFLSILQSYPAVGTNNDWNELIKNTHGDEKKFTVLTENIINYIVKSKDKAFAMEIFNLIDAQAGDWADAGRIYLRSLLTSDEVAQNVFPTSAFNGRTKKFVISLRSYYKKYLSSTIKMPLEETKVWQNYTIACKRQKTRNLIIAVVSLIAAAGVALGTFFYLHAVKKDTVKFDVDNVIEVVYGESIDLSSYTVSYKRNSGKEVTEPITIKMLQGYDPEKVGEQQTVQCVFAGVKQAITVRVDYATLATPNVSHSGNYISWEFVPNAADYGVYVNSSTAAIATTTSLSYDLSRLENFGDLKVTVRANAKNNKYKSSAMSEELTITKLQPPKNIRYEDGKLKWDAVAGAASYELSINDTPVTVTENSYTTTFSKGTTKVEITAKSAENTVVAGYASKDIFYSKILPATNLTYSNNRVQWTADEDASAYKIYVDGEYWKDFYRTYFDVNTDGFIEAFGETTHQIGIVSTSSNEGYENSEMATFNVGIGNKAQLTDGVIHWNSVGTGATYSLKIKGTERKLSSPNFSIEDFNWEVGENNVSLTATSDGNTTVLESFTVTKLAKPQVSVSNKNWLTDNAANNRYSIDGGSSWETSLPDISSLPAGTINILAKKVRTASALEIESETAQITLIKPVSPIISIDAGSVECTYDEEAYALKLYYSTQSGGTFSPIASLDEIHVVGTYYIKAALGEKSHEDGKIVVESDYSAESTVIKPAAPSVIYNEGDAAVTSDTVGVKFYYMENGEEKELVGGLISNLPAGIIEVYARVPASGNTLASENTPANSRVSIFNMSITLSINKANDSQMYAVFGGCSDIDSLVYTYEIKLYNSGNTYVGGRKQLTEVTATKSNIQGTDNIVAMINYRLGADFESGYSQADVKKVELVVYLKSGANVQQLSATMNA